MLTLFFSHDNDDEEVTDKREKIKNTFNIMGLYLHPDSVPKGEVVYRKRLARLRLPRSKRFNVSKKTYFDDEGHPYSANKVNKSESGESESSGLAAHASQTPLFMQIGQGSKASSRKVEDLLESLSRKLQGSFRFNYCYIYNRLSW